MLSRLAAYVRGLANRRSIDREVDEELQFHLEQEAQALISRGFDRRGAHGVEAHRSLGGELQTRDAVRDVRTVWLDTLWRDTRQAFRGLSGAPTFTCVALVVLALSIGASTAIFSVVDAVVLRALPFDESDRLVSVGEVNIRKDSPTASRRVAPQNFIDWKARQSVFTHLAAIGDVSISLKRSGAEEPEVLRAQWVTADFFAVLRAAPMLGGPFTVENEVTGRAHVAVISHRLWQRRYGGSLDVIGQYLPGQLASFEIVGVMPPTFAFPVGEPEPTDVWVPYVVPERERVRGNTFGYNLQVIGRLRDGVTLEQAQAQMDQITAVLAAETPRWFEDRVAGVSPLQLDLTRSIRTWMLMLLAAVGLVLATACVNLANLMLIRATTRARELSVRAALGASRADLLRTLLVEALVLSLTGSFLGVLLAWAGVALLGSVVPAEVPRAALIAIDVRVLIVAAITAIATGLFFGIVPAIRFSRVGARSAYLQTERGGTATPSIQRLRGVLVVAQVAMALVLLLGAGLFLASFSRVTAVDLGFEHADILSVRVRPLVSAEMPATLTENRDKLLRVRERVAGIPGVQAVDLIGGSLPLRGDLRTARLTIPGRVLSKNEDIALNEISPTYFSTLRVPILLGRPFTDDDREGSEPVAILSDAAARKYFPQGNALDSLLRLDVDRRIVGISGSVRDQGPEQPVRSQAYVPLAQRQLPGRRSCSAQRQERASCLRFERRYGQSSRTCPYPTNTHSTVYTMAWSLSGGS